MMYDLQPITIIKDLDNFTGCIYQNKKKIIITSIQLRTEGIETKNDYRISITFDQNNTAFNQIPLFFLKTKLETKISVNYEISYYLGGIPISLGKYGFINTETKKSVSFLLCMFGYEREKE